MRLYSSFLVRCWLTEDGLPGAQSVLRIDHIQTGASKRATKLSELEPWVFEACRTARLKVEARAEANNDNQSQGDNESVD